MMRIFVSGSATTEHDRDLLDSLKQRLVGDGHLVFSSDSDVEQGARWRSRLYEELAACEAGIALITGRALTSRWIQRELNVLLWRRSLNPRTMVIPVLVDTTSLAEIAASGLSGLEDFMFLRVARQ